MADAYEMEASTDNYLLEDGSGYYLLEGGAIEQVPSDYQTRIYTPIIAQ